MWNLWKKMYRWKKMKRCGMCEDVRKMKMEIDGKMYCMWRWKKWTDVEYANLWNLSRWKKDAKMCNVYRCETCKKMKRCGICEDVKSWKRCGKCEDVEKTLNSKDAKDEKCRPCKDVKHVKTEIKRCRICEDLQFVKMQKIKKM